MTELRDISRELLLDLIEALAVACSAVCAAVIVKDGKSPVHIVGDSDTAQLLLTLYSVQASLADGIPRTESAPPDLALTDTAFIAIEPIAIPLTEFSTAVIVFAGRHMNDCGRIVALLHSLATETANELMFLRQMPFLASALSEIECGVTISDPNLADNPLIYANAAFERMTGYRRAELLGINCRFLQGDLQDQPGLQIIRNAIARGTDCTVEITNFRRSGESFQNRLKLRTIRTTDGAVSHIIGIQLDVTKETSALDLLDRQRRRYSSLVETQSSYIWSMGPTGEVLEAPEKWLALAGLPLSSGTPPDLAAVRGALTPAGAEAFREGWAKAIQHGTPFEVTYQLPAQSPSPTWLLDRVTPVRDEQNNLLEWIVVSQEVTHLKRAEEYLKSIIDSAPNGMMVVDNKGGISLANRQAGVLFGYSPEAMVGMPVEALVPASVRSRHRQMRADFLASPTMRRMSPEREVEGVRKDGTRFPLEVGLNAYGEGDERHVIVAFSDVSELRHALQDVERAAFEDRLTGVLSTEGFAQRLDELLRKGNLHPATPAVAVDLKSLSGINNTQGYGVGDEVLREVARRLMAEVGEGGLVGRTGGDEFTVLSQLTHHRSRRQLRQLMAAVFDPSFEIRGFVFHVDASFGYVRLRSSGGGDARKLMTDAALAMHKSQHNPALAWTQYTNVLERETHETVELTTMLRHAVEADQLELYYQPKVDLASGRIVSAEALLRWNHPQVGFIPPDKFIPLAEQSQLIGPIGDWVLRQACRDLKAWRDAGLAVTPVSINLSLIQLQIGSVPDKVNQALTDYEVAPEELILEITESVFERQGQALKTDLEALRTLGVGLSLDDFGTGYSSLGHLKDYFFDEIKIDKSFIGQLDEGPYGQAIVKAIILIAAAIGANVVAEGIELPEQTVILRQLGCATGQGYHFSRPLPEPGWRQLLIDQHVLPEPAVSRYAQL